MGSRIQDGAGARDLLNSIERILTALPPTNRRETVAEGFCNRGGQALSGFARELPSQFVCLIALDTQHHDGIILPNLEEWHNSVRSDAHRSKKSEAADATS